MFDAMAWLNDSGIPYSLHGKNISQGWIGLSSCFRCGKRTGVAKLIATIENCSSSAAWHIFNSHSNILKTPDYFEKTRASHVEWPPPACKEIPLLAHADYIYERGYDLEQLISTYDIKFGWYTGNFKYRIIIPVYLQGRVVSYIGRDISNQATLKYKNLKEELSILPVKETVYNIDNIHEEAIICEGVFDAWRFGYNAVAMFGLVYTQRQVRMLGDKLKKAYICFDAEPQAREAAETLGEELSWQGVDVEILSIDTKDPGEMSQREADELKQELFGNEFFYKKC